MDTRKLLKEMHEEDVRKNRVESENARIDALNEKFFKYENKGGLSYTSLNYTNLEEVNEKKDKVEAKSKTLKLEADISSNSKKIEHFDLNKLSGIKKELAFHITSLCLQSEDLSFGPVKKEFIQGLAKKFNNTFYTTQKYLMDLKKKNVFLNPYIEQTKSKFYFFSISQETKNFFLKDHKKYIYDNQIQTNKKVFKGTNYKKLIFLTAIQKKIASFVIELCLKNKELYSDKITKNQINEFLKNNNLKYMSFRKTIKNLKTMKLISTKESISRRNGYRVFQISDQTKQEYLVLKNQETLNHKLEQDTFKETETPSLENETITELSPDDSQVKKKTNDSVEYSSQEFSSKENDIKKKEIEETNKKINIDIEENTKLKEEKDEDELYLESLPNDWKNIYFEKLKKLKALNFTATHVFCIHKSNIKLINFSKSIDYFYYDIFVKKRIVHKGFFNYFMSCIKGDRAYHMPDGYVDDKTIEAQILKQKQEEERLFNQKLEKDNLLKQQKEKEDAAFEIWWNSCSKEERTELIEKKNQGIWFFRNKIDFDSIIDLKEIRNSEKPCLSNMILLQNIKDYFLENVFPYLNCAENLPIQVEEG